MVILGIDPGNEQSAWLRYDAASHGVVDFDLAENESARTSVLQMGSENLADLLAIEYMVPRGMPTSKEEMDTQFFAGRLVEAWGGDWTPVLRREVKQYLCGSMSAKDANVRQALIDRFPATGGGSTPQVGVKDQPGPLYGISKDLWSALAIAVTCAEYKAEEIRGH